MSLRQITSTKLTKMKKNTLKITMASEVQAVYSKKDKIETTNICSSREVSEFAKRIFPVDTTYREAMICLFLNRANKIIGYATMSIGGTSGTMCDPKMIFQHALLSNASSIILVHNHPSGQLKPSNEDLKLTKKIKDGGNFLDIKLLDHLIITEESYYSFADEGTL